MTRWKEQVGVRLAPFIFLLRLSGHQYSLSILLLLMMALMVMMVMMVMMNENMEIGIYARGWVHGC